MTHEEIYHLILELPPAALRRTLANDDWRVEKGFVPDEVVFRILRQPWATGDCWRMEIASETLARRVLQRARHFVRKTGIFPSQISDLDEASSELASYFWEKLLSPGGNPAHAETAFGQFFARRAVDFQRSLYAQKRGSADNPAMREYDEPGEEAADSNDECWSPEQVLERKQEYEELKAATTRVLSQDEFITLELLYNLDMSVTDAAALRGVSPKTIFNQRRRAFNKLREELRK